MGSVSRVVLVLVLVAGGTVAACGGGKSETAGVAAAITLVGDPNLTGVVGQELPAPVTVQVTDASGTPVQGQLVTFHVVSGGGSVFSGASITDADGIVQERWTLGTSTAEEQSLEARAVDNASGAPIVFATFTATALPDAPVALAVAAGDGQGVAAGAELADPIVVAVTDQYGNPAPDVEVTWTVADGGGAVADATSTTDALGQASTRWTLGDEALEQHVQAAAIGTSVEFVAHTTGGIAVAIVAVAGVGQAGFPGSAVVEVPTVRVQDSAGAPVPGVQVAFEVISGGGAITTTTTVTNAQGLADCGSWTLGDTPGENELAATAAVGSVTFTATGMLPTSMTKQAGDGQMAPTGTAVPVAPAVRVLHTYSTLAGVPVTFAITSGAGSVTTATSTTDEMGIATCGAWTLGPAVGLNTLTASAPGLPTVTFTAHAAVQASDMTVTAGVSPSGTVVDRSFVVWAQVTGTASVASVTGALGSQSVDFVYSTVRIGYSDIVAWHGTFSTSAAPYGPVEVVVTATSTLGHVGNAFVDVTNDWIPSVTVTLPLPEALGRPALDVAATCDDNDPDGCTVYVKAKEGATDVELAQEIAQNDCLAGAYGWTILASGTAPLAQSLDLSSFEGKIVNLCFVGQDATNSSSGVMRRVYVESSSHLSLVATVPGHVRDVADGKLLWVDAASSTLRLHDIAAETDEDVVTDADVFGYFWIAYLTPHGVLHAKWDTAVQQYAVFELRDGTTLSLGNCDVAPQVKGHYALLSRPSLVASTLVLRDLDAGTDTTVATNTAPASSSDLAANGDVVYYDATWGYVYRYHAGTTTQVSSDVVGVVADNPCGPLTDGANVAYVRQGASSYVVHLNDGAGEVTLATTACPALLTNGWMIYGYWTGSEGQVWRHGPSGEELPFSSSDPAYSELPRGLAPDGTVILDLGHASVRRYRAVPGSALEDIGSVFSVNWPGPLVYRGGQFLEVVGGSVLAIGP